MVCSCTQVSGRSKVGSDKARKDLGNEDSYKVDRKRARACTRLEESAQERARVDKCSQLSLHLYRYEEQQAGKINETLL